MWGLRAPVGTGAAAEKEAAVPRLAGNCQQAALRSDCTARRTLDLHLALLRALALVAQLQDALVRGCQGVLQRLTLDRLQLHLALHVTHLPLHKLRRGEG